MSVFAQEAAVRLLLTSNHMLENQTCRKNQVWLRLTIFSKLPYNLVRNSMNSSRDPNGPFNRLFLLFFQPVCRFRGILSQYGKNIIFTKLKIREVRLFLTLNKSNLI